jgi:hypothetical protein
MEGGDQSVSTIDQRIVNMQFNNQQFESGVATSLNTLDKLKKGLNLSGATKGLTDLSQVGKNFSLSGIADGVDSISRKFSTLSIIGITALANIANSAVNAGKNIVKSLTIDPITAGFSKYEQKVVSVQTIMNATGASMEVVDKQLAKLTWFTDETSYSFTEMASNIGKFTSSGVALDTSVTAMIGIANWAAVSGQNTATASRAMYQLAGAIGSGAVKLQDWMSIENANMATKEFKTTVIDTAKAMGIINKQNKIASGKGKGTVVNTENFRTTLQEGWFTNKVLLKALDKYGGYAEKIYKTATEQGLSAAEAMELASSKGMELGAKSFKAAQEAKTLTDAINATKDAVSSKWMISSELLFGNFVEAKVLWTDLAGVLYDVFAASGDARNEMLMTWKSLGGRTALIEAISGAFQVLVNVFTPIKDAFREIFPPLTGKQLFDFTNGLKNLITNFKIGEPIINNIKRIFKGLFAFIDIGLMGIKAFSKWVGKLITFLLPAGESLLNMSATMGDFVVGLRDSLKSTDAFNKFFSGLGRFIEPIILGFIQHVKDIFTIFDKVDTTGLDSFTDKVKARFAPLEVIGNAIKNVFNGLLIVLDNLMPVFEKIKSVIGTVFIALGKKIAESMKTLNFDSIFDLINGSIFVGILFGVKKFLTQLSTVLSGGGNILGPITEILDGVKNSISAWQTSINAKTILTIAIAMAILTGAIIALSLVDSEKLAGALLAMSGLFVELFGSMAIFEKIVGGPGFKSMAKVTTSLIGLSLAILILSLAVSKLGKLNWQDLVKGLGGVAILSATLVTSATILEKSSGKLIKGSAGLVIFALAILLLAEAVTKLSSLDMVALGKGLLGVGIICVQLATFLNLTDFSKLSLAKAFGLMLMAISVGILANAVEKLGKLSAKQIIKGLGTLYMILGELFVFTQFTGDPKLLISTAISIGILGLAMLVFAKALQEFGKMSVKEIAKGLIAMAGALVIIIGTLKLMPKGILASSIGLLIMSVALIALSKALKTMGGMSADDIGKSLIMLAGALGIITVAMLFMKTALPGAIALFIISGALTMLAAVLKIFSKMTLKEIGKSLLMLAGVFAIIGLAALILAPIILPLLALSAAILIFGLACMAVGAGITAFAAGLTALSIAGGVGAAALESIVIKLIDLIPRFLRKIGEGILSFCDVIREGAPAIGAAITAVGLALISTLGTLGSELIVKILDIITTALDKLAESVPQWVDAGMKIILGFVEGVANNIGAITTAAADVAINFIDGITKKLPDIINSAFLLFISFVNGLADSIRDNSPLIKDAAWNLIDAILGAIADLIGLGWLYNTGKDIVDNIVKGCRDFGAAVNEIGKNMIKGITGGVKDETPSLVTESKKSVTKAVNGMKVALNERSPSRVTRKIGVYFSQGLINGILSLSDDIVTSGKDVGKLAVDSMSNAVAKVSDILVGQDGSLNPVITPVLDLSEVTKGQSTISSLFGKRQGINVAGQYGDANLINQGLKLDTGTGTSFQGALGELKDAVRNEFEKAQCYISGVLTVQVVNDRGEIIGIAQTAVKDLLRKESR